ncbi:hypothetical protein KIW84_063440 [Lathyrus oleraceus]|uniref:Uncharacterized protein n=1 Tax=Pisum sativum TaxID=3888 RepID=A0A9D5A795_PEA|nr:hypothetical protein KIW84_063440 [Pisum sativum]
METLQKFCILSRQEVNEEKSNIIFSKNISRGLRNKLLNISKFRETNQFEKFLGVSISERNFRRANYQFIIDQVSNRLLNWKRLKDYNETLFGETNNGRKVHAVNWKTITTPEENGGPRLRDISAMNHACILKLARQLINDAEDLWCVVLRGLYKGNQLSDRSTRKKSNSNVWRDFNKYIPHLLNHGKWLIGNGSSVDTWGDSWLDSGTCICDQVHSILDNVRGENICDLETYMGDWNWQLLQPWIPYGILDKMTNIKPPN